MKRQTIALVLAPLAAACLAGLAASPAAAQSNSPPRPTLGFAPLETPAVMHLTLEEAKQRVLADSKLLNLAARNIKSKEYATWAAQALYFPQIFGTSVYFHFDDNLGEVLETRSRTFRGPLGRFDFTTPGRVVAVPIIDQNSEYTTINALQPITDLLKVRQGVKIARADEQIAQAELDKGARALVSGVEQLFWGLLAAQRIRAGAQTAVAGAEQLAGTGSPEAKIALVEARQGLQQVEAQIGDLQDQLAILLDVPTCTAFDLVEPPAPVAPVKCADEAVALALAASPDVREAQQNVVKAEAAVAAAKVDYLPNIAVVGGYANNNMIDVIQPNYSYAGVVGNWTLLDWGKRRNTVRERDEIVAMAHLKVQQTQDQVRQDSLKAFRDYVQSGVAFDLAGQMLEGRKEAEKAAAAPAAKFAAARDLMEAQVDYIKADLAQRVAYVKLMALIGQQ